MMAVSQYREGCMSPTQRTPILLNWTVPRFGLFSTAFPADINKSRKRASRDCCASFG